MINYKKYTDDDYEFVYNLKKNAYKDYVIKYYGEYNEDYQKNRFDERIKNIKDNVYIIYYNEKIKLGFYTLSLCDDYVELENICIDEAYRGLGIGTRVIKDIIKKYRKDIKLQYFKDNPVYKLYEKLGFVIDGENDNHYTMTRKR